MEPAPAGGTVGGPTRALGFQIILLYFSADKLPFEGVLTENLNIVLQIASCNST